MNESFDVVVAGAGPVGLMLACELGLAGVSVLVVERLDEIDPTIKAGGINQVAAQALYRRGLLPAMVAEQSAALSRMGVPAAAPGGAPQRPPFIGHFAGIMLGVDLVDFDHSSFADLGPAASVYLVPQQSIEAVLGRRAAELGVTVRRGVELTDFTDDGAGVTVRLGDDTVRAGWLVGCDGGRSLVRKRAGFDFPGLDPELTGHQAVVEMTGAEGLRPGWNTTDTGMYVHGPTPGRILTVQLDGPPADRTAPITAAELQAALRAVSGVPVEITAVHSATRFTDNTRQVTEYRRGRVLLAGDAAHVHSPFGGQGLNLGVGDAVNLGWKLAAVVRGDAEPELLDTYTTERHPVGAWVLDWTRAQVALMRTDRRSRELRAVMTELLATREAATLVFRKISGVLHRYDLGGGHERVGAAVPDFELSDGTRLGRYFADGAPVLFDLADSAELRAVAAPWRPRVRVVTAKAAVPGELTGMLVRPDGFVAWAADSGGRYGLESALTRWFGPAA
ncbi:2-polyprenyl-6-methoxyphenol hydroxylase-like FAD-dependent oxidoreductase [Nocardia tenerifensis]|uniref:2-polyprenyl-6-methoxyphenol hydroxylase-like FAD-dependent oxidoreductase n=1 Tax=Nocardia tenerifensis TaxID=228006 RepID=A0A318JRG0_9NOCA|nr:FAD-dependent monooxygenase [Nocardia tenerifensis]PXX57465.1 2-polyprenyl-6-methoxyphenol hydroxylase-like FAD-dependent oxidoreductase [Nocardia tenerifensis]